MALATSNRPARLLAWLLATTALLPLAARPAAGQAQGARPSGGQVVAGSAAIAQDAAATTIRQTTDRAAIDWRSFDVGSRHSVRFEQPSAQSWTLNRVVGPDPSRIAGRITANGGVAIVNQSGVVFAEGAQVNVGALIAGAANISTPNFMAGRMVFDGAPDPGAAVENHGTISVADRGLAALVGPAVRNTGTINARLGRVTLAGAETYRLDLAGDGLLAIDVTQAVRTAPGGGAALVTNTGVIAAEGGRVLLGAEAASGLVEDVVRHSGRIAADSTAERPGAVALRGVGGAVTVDGAISAQGGAVLAGGGLDIAAPTIRIGGELRVDGARGGSARVQATGAMTQTGTVSARGAAPDGRGGRVALFGERVVLSDQARVDASGAAGGGTILIGGALQGLGPDPNARSNFIGPGVVLAADATSRGDGGQVIVWADERTRFYGRITARGGAAGGDGGFAEVSAKGTLVYAGTTDLTAPRGRAGTLLLDPTNIDVVAAASPVLPGDVDQFSDPDADAGLARSSIDVALINAATANVVLQATNDIVFVAPVSISTSTVGLTAQAGNSIDVQSGSGITTRGGHIRLTANDPGGTPTGSGGITIAAPLITSGGNLTGGEIVLTVASGSGAIRVGATALDTLNGAVTLSGPVTLTANTRIDTTAAGSIAATSGAAIALGAVTGGGFDLALRTGSLATGTISGTSIAGVGTLALDGAGGTVAFTGAVSAASLTVSNSVQNLSLTGSGGTISNAVMLTNPGTLALGQAGGTQSFAGGLTLSGPTSTNLAGTIAATNADLNFAGTAAILAADTILSAGTGTITLGSVTTGGRAFTVTANEIALIGGANSVIGGGALTLQPGAANRTIGINGGSGAFSLDASDLAALADGFASVTIGRADGAHAIDIAAVTLRDPTIFRAPAAGGAITVNGQITGVDDAAVTLTGPGATTTLNANIVTAGRAIVINDSIRLGVPAVQLDTTNAGAVAAGEAITLGGPVDSVAGNTHALTLNAGTGGAISVTGAVGGADPLSTLTVQNSGGASFSGAVTTNSSVVLANSTGTIAFGGVLTTPTLTTASQAYGLALNGGAAITNAVTFQNTGALTLGNDPTRVLSFAGGIVATAPSAITLNGQIRTAGQAATLGDADTAVTLAGGASRIDTTNNGAVAAGAMITLGGAVDASAAGGQSLTAISGAGDIRFDGAIGAVVELGTLTANGSGETRFLGTLRATDLTTDAGGTTRLDGGAATTSGVGGMAFNDAVTLTVATVLNAGTGPIAFGGTVDGAFALTANSTGATSFAAAVGGVTPLTSLTTNAGGTASLRSVTTSGAQSYGENATLNGTYTTSNAAFDIAGTTTLAGATLLSTGTGAITFTGAVDGAFALTANSSGTTRFVAAVGGGTPLASLTTDAGGTTRLDGGAATTSGVGGMAFNDAVTLTVATVLNAGTGPIAFGGTVDGAFALTANSTGATSFAAAVGGVTPLTSLTTNAGGTTRFDGGAATTSGVGGMALNDAVTLTVATVLNAGTGPIAFGGTVDGAFALTANSTGATSFAAAVGGVTPLASLTTDAGGTASLRSVTTSGAQSYGENATLNGTYTTSNAAFDIAGTTTLAGTTLLSTGTGAVTFTGAVDGAFALTANSSGTTRFVAAVGGGTPLASLTTDAGGTTRLDGGAATTSGVGGMAFNDAVTLTVATVLNAGTGPIAFGGTVDGAFALTANSTGATSFAAAVGGVTPLTSLTTNAGGTTRFDGGAATTSGVGGMALNDAVTLTVATVLNAGTGPIAFGGTVDGAFALTANSTGATSFAAAVGGVTPLASLTTDAGGTASLRSVTTSGAQSYGENATLNGTYTTSNAAFDIAGTTTLAGATLLSTGTGAITFTGAVDGAFALTANSSGTTRFVAAVGGGTPLASLTTDAGGTTRLDGGAATTSGVGGMAFNDAVTLTVATVLNAGTGPIAFAGTVDGAFALTANSTGATSFAAAVGGVTPLASLTTNAGGTASLRSVTTSGAQSYGENATLNGTYTTSNATFDIAGTTTLAGTTLVSTGTGAITFTGTVDGAFALTANSTGATSFAAAVGGVTPLASLTTNAGGTASLRSVTTSGAQSYGENATLNGTYTTSNAAFDIAGTTTLAGTTLVSTGTGAVTFTGAVDGAFALTANSTGATSFAAAVGGVTPLASLTTNAGGTASLGSVTTSGAQSYGENTTLSGTYTTSNSAFDIAGTTTLAGAVTVATGSGAVTFTGAVDGGQALAVNSTGTTLFAAAVGGVAPLASLGTNAGSTIALESNVSTAGPQSYNGAMVLNGPVVLVTANGALLVAGALDSQAGEANALTVSTGTANVSFGGPIGGAVAGALGAISIGTANDVTFLGTVRAASLIQTVPSTGTIRFDGALALTAPSGAVTLQAPVIDINATMTTAGGDIGLRADALDVGAAVTAPAATILIDPLTATRAVTLGGVAAGRLALDPADIAFLSTANPGGVPGRVVVRTRDPGAELAVIGDARLTAADSGALTLISAGALTMSAGTVSASGRVLLQADGALTVTGGAIASSGTAVDTLVGSAGFAAAEAGAVGLPPGAALQARRGLVVLRTSGGGLLSFAQAALDAEAAALETGGVLRVGHGSALIGSALTLTGAGRIEAVGNLTVTARRADARPAVVYDSRAARGADPLAQIRPDTPGLTPAAQPTQIRAAPQVEQPGAFGVASTATAGPVALSLSAGASPVFLLVDGGTVTGNIAAGRLGVHGSGGSMTLLGSLDGTGGEGAARFADITRPVTTSVLQKYKINDCVITSVNCVVAPAVQLFPARRVDIVDLRVQTGRGGGGGDVVIPNAAEAEYE